MTMFFSWSCDMKGHAPKCVERFCEQANKTIEQQYKTYPLCVWMTINSKRADGELSNVCAQRFVTYLYLATHGQTGRLVDSQWIVQAEARGLYDVTTNARVPRSLRTAR